jgi:hypothetical protein
MNEELNISYKNYDLVVKEALSVFENKTLNFLGLDLPKIIRVEETELYKIETKNHFIDLNFLLEDGSILHIEEEISISEEDLIRFAQTDLMMYGKKKREIHTVVLTKEVKNKHLNQFDTGSLKYKVIVIELNRSGGDEKYKELKKRIDNHEAINELELIFLPIMKTEESPEVFLEKTIELAKEIDETPEERVKIISMMLVLMDKYLTREKIMKIWEDLKMLNILKVAEEIYTEKGKEIGKEELLWRQISKKFPKVENVYYEKLKKLDAIKLDTLSLELLDMKKASELDRYL